MIHVDVRTDFRAARIYLRHLSTDQGIKRATARALNRTATSVRAEAARMLRQKRALRIGDIKKAMRIVRATTKKLVAEVVVSGKPISIRHFSRLRFERMGGKRTGISGISAKILQADRAKLLRRHGNKAFTNPRIGGGLAIVYRKGKQRLPISAWAPVPGLPTVLVQEKIASALKLLATSMFKERLKDELNYEINVARRKAMGPREFGSVLGVSGGRVVRAFQ